MRNILLSFMLLLCVFSYAQQKTPYEVIKSDLRASAYPLITIDPYTSAWSASDKLYDSAIQHWTGADFPFIGVVKVDGVSYRFMGTENVEMKPIVPTSLQSSWEGRYTTNTPRGNWTSAGFDDSDWKTGKGAFGTMENEPTAKTQWGTRNIWVRRTVIIEDDFANRPVYLEFSNDDDAVFYINGVKVYSTGATCNKNKLIQLPAEAVAALKRGKNLIAAECINPVGNGLLDFGLLVPKELHTVFAKTANQRSVNVQATQTHYTFTCGNIDLKLTFTAPLLMDDLNLISRPVNYVTYSVAANDGKLHDIDFYFETSPRWALDVPYQESTGVGYEKDGLVYLKTGSKEQNILAKKGDDLRIDWGYFYLATSKAHTRYAVGCSTELRDSFVKGAFAKNKVTGENEHSHLALVRNYGKVKYLTDKIMVGYDDIYSIQYFNTNLRPYWNKSGDKTIESQFQAADKEYTALLGRCYSFDKKLMKEATEAGGKEYAELCALAYRQAISAHKLVEAPNGDLLFLSKENNSNGSIGTVDITYPSSPLFLYYNPELAKGLMNHIYYYSESGKWVKPFPSHDVGTYPIANGQTYGGDMPIEEAGNMLILTAAVCNKEDKVDYARKHWKVLTIWAEYLVENGLDPENQLCTDDFAGHFAHNTNLSVKAILGIASYARMAEMQGLKDVADKYYAVARDYAQRWETMAKDGDHYKLTFDKAGTWSQKYNLVWDKLLGLNIFPKQIIPTEIAYYLTKQNIYGLPLDNRETYTKTDWIIWTATLSGDKATFQKFIGPLYKFENETIDRVPMSDWVFTDKPSYRGFKARSVVGGYFIKMLEYSNTKKK